MHLCSVLYVCVCVDMSVLLDVHMCAHVCEGQRLSSSKHPHSLLSILVLKQDLSLNLELTNLTRLSGNEL